MIEDADGISHEFKLESEKYIGIKSDQNLL